MTDSLQKQRRRGPMMLAEMVSRILGPVTARRGFATTDLIAAWPEIVGPRYADCSRPEKIVWPKGESNEGRSAVLVLRVDGPRAIFVQHEAGQLVERVNAFLGYAAIGQIRIIQAPVTGRAGQTAVAPQRLDPEDERHLAETTADVADDDLRAALNRLGRSVLADRKT